MCDRRKESLVRTCKNHSPTTDGLRGLIRGLFGDGPTVICVGCEPLEVFVGYHPVKW
jgi:hypothetical protein